MVTIVDPHIKRDDDYHIHRVSSYFLLLILFRKLLPIYAAHTARFVFLLFIGSQLQRLLREE